MWQGLYTDQTCSTAHDRLKSGPIFDLKSTNLFTGEPEPELKPQEASLDLIIETRPELFAPINVEPIPYKSRCVNPLEHPITGSLDERMAKLQQLPQLHREYNECKEDDIMKRIAWSQVQRKEVDRIIKREERRRIKVIQAEMAEQRRRIAEDLKRAQEAKKRRQADKFKDLTFFETNAIYWDDYEYEK